MYIQKCLKSIVIQYQNVFLNMLMSVLNVDLVEFTGVPLIRACVSKEEKYYAKNYQLMGESML